MTLWLLWLAALLTALGLRRGIRWHYRRWFAMPFLCRPRVARSRRLLLDPLIPIIPTRRLLS